MDHLITIVVPCYNVEKFIDRTLHSIVNQSYKNLEIILVNDGSTDGTGDKLEIWATGDNRIKVVHQENGGVSHARNTGIGRASGRYISFVDADDIIDVLMIEKLYELIENHDAQMSACFWDNLYEDSDRVSSENSYIKVFKTKEAIESALRGKELSCGVTGKLYEINLFDHVRFPLGMTIEDAYIIMELILQCSRVVFLNEGLYHYFHREGSLMHREFSQDDFNIIKAHVHNKEVILEVYPELGFLVEQRLSWAYLYVWDKFLLSGKEDNPLKKTLKREVLRRYKYIVGGNYFNKGRKLAVTLLFFSTRVYKAFVVYRQKNYVAHEV